MILGFHCVFSAYGFWLPNDPRGSGSNEVWSRQLRTFGDATRVTSRRSVAHAKHDHKQRLQAKQCLRYPPVRLTGLQARAVGRGFSTSAETLQLTIYACAIMPDHVHLVLGRHSKQIGSIIAFLKRAATRRLTLEDLHPLVAHRRTDGRVPSPWGEDGWNVYLNAADEVRRAIRYVENNPVRAGLPPQRWSFVVPYDA